MNLTRKIALGIFSLAAVFGMAACGSAEIGTAKSAPDLQGVTVSETLPATGVTVQRVHIDGSALQEGKSYKFNNVSLTVEGNVPTGAKIYGTNGQILVTGNVGSKAKIEITVPEYFHIVPSTCTGLMPISTGKTTVLIPYTYDCSYRVDDGPMAPYDKEPVIVVQGQLGQKVALNSSVGTRAATQSP